VPTVSLPQTPAPPPLTYTPPYLAERIITSRAALEGERKQVTVLFADLKGSMELLADRDPEEARQLLDPVLERMMAAGHRSEGTAWMGMKGRSIRSWVTASWPCSVPLLPMKTMLFGPAMRPSLCSRPWDAMPRRCGASRGSMYRCVSA